jgi:hypothetical protein
LEILVVLFLLVQTIQVLSINGSAKVAKLISQLSEAHWFNNRISSAHRFSTKKVIKMKVWSPKAGIVIKNA